MDAFPVSLRSCGTVLVRPSSICTAQQQLQPQPQQGCYYYDNYYYYKQLQQSAMMRSVQYQYHSKRRNVHSLASAISDQGGRVAHVAAPAAFAAAASDKILPASSCASAATSSSSGQVDGGTPANVDQINGRPKAIAATATGEMASSEEQQAIDRAINGMIVAAACAFAITKILTVDRDYWHGWTLFEIVRYAPLHNWSAYEDALKSNPVLAKMMISGVVYSIGDWIAQCYEGKPILEINRKRILRSGLVGFSLHGSLSHFYYHICEFIFPFSDWWGVPIKVAFDQTIWSGFWNSIYFIVLGLLRFESPKSIATELKTTFWPMLTAGWKLWPFAHLITYGVIPIEQRLLWVDCVELIWVTILSMYSNEKAEARILEGPQDSISPTMNTISTVEQTSKLEDAQ